MQSAATLDNMQRLYDRYMDQPLQQLLRATSVRIENQEPENMDLTALNETERAIHHTLTTTMKKRQADILTQLKGKIPTDDQASDLFSLSTIQSRLRTWPMRYQPQPKAENTLQDLLWQCRKSRDQVASPNTTASPLFSQNSSSDELTLLDRLAQQDQPSVIDDTPVSSPQPSAREGNATASSTTAVRTNHYSPLPSGIDLDEWANQPEKQTTAVSNNRTKGLTIRPQLEFVKSGGSKRGLDQVTGGSTVDVDQPSVKRRCDTQAKRRPAPISVRGIKSPLSNFSFAEITYCGRRYTSVEQGYQCEKAVHFNNETMSRRIRTTHNGSHCKALGRRIINKTVASSLVRTWEQRKVVVLFGIMKTKFMRNRKASQCLRDTGNAEIFHNVSDTFWGTGSNDPIWQPNPPGRDIFSKLLMRIRADMFGTAPPAPLGGIEEFLASCAPTPAALGFPIVSTRGQLAPKSPRQGHEHLDRDQTTHQSPLNHREVSGQPNGSNLISPRNDRAEATPRITGSRQPIPVRPTHDGATPRDGDDQLATPQRPATVTPRRDQGDLRTTQNLPPSLLDMMIPTPPNIAAHWNRPNNSRQVGGDTYTVTGSRAQQISKKPPSGLTPLPIEQDQTTVILGDSQVSRMTIPARYSHVATIAMPGAQFVCMYNRLRFTTTHEQVTKVILAVGINNRTQDYWRTAQKKLRSMVTAAGRVFPNAQIGLAEVAHSKDLAWEHLRNLADLNREIHRECSTLAPNAKGIRPRVIPLPESPLEFESRMDRPPIHLLPRSADCLLLHWLKYTGN